MNDKEILLANPRGFCAGVERAIEIVERALVRFGAPIYVRHEVVHNKFVVDGLRAKGAVFIEDLADVPPGNTVIFSAHGVSQAVRAEAVARGLQVSTPPVRSSPRSLEVAHARTGTGYRDDRPQGPSRSRRHHGTGQGWHSPRRDRRRRRRAAGRQSRAAGLCDADHPVDG